MVHEVYIDAEADTPPEVDRQIRRSVLAVLEEERVDVPCIVEVCVTDDEGSRQILRIWWITCISMESA